MTDQYHWSVEICSSSHETSCYRFYIQRERIPSKASLLAVLGVCQEWCYTGQEIFYKRNHFHFTSLGQFVEVLETDMTLRQRQLVSQITIVWVHYSDAYRYIPNKLKDFVSLRNLRLLLYHNAREPSSIRGNLGKSTCLGRLKDLRNLESLTVVCPENDKCSMCKEQQERLEAKYVRLSKSSKKATPASWSQAVPRWNDSCLSCLKLQCIPRINTQILSHPFNKEVFLCLALLLRGWGRHSISRLILGYFS